jgi:RNA polymerase sigma-70 factor, ECF subfamily
MAHERIEGALMEMGMPGLVDAARHGDREAFEALVRAGSGRLYAIAYRILRDADLANDALQEALVRIWDDLPTLRDPDRYDPWTYRITCRACYRVAKRERRTSVATLVERMTPESSAFESEIADRDEMERGFRRLSPEHRAVLVLHYYLGLTIGEVAEVLRIAPGTVGSRVHYAMRSLRASLASEARSTEAMERSR